MRSSSHQPIVVVVGLLLLLLLPMVMSRSPVELTFSINEFDIIELDLYNSMISCVALFKDHFVECNKSIKSIANTAFGLVPQNSTLGGIVKCCGIWLVRDCWLRHALPNCTHYVERLPFKLLPKLDVWCDVYHEHSFVCSIPRNTLVAAAAVTLLVVAMLAVVIVVCVAVRRWRKIRRKLSGTMATDEEGDFDVSSTMAKEREDLRFLDQNSNQVQLSC